jgi:hypothetical protein
MHSILVKQEEAKQKKNRTRSYYLFLGVYLTLEMIKYKFKRKTDVNL